MSTSQYEIISLYRYTVQLHLHIVINGILTQDRFLTSFISIKTIFKKQIQLWWPINWQYPKCTNISLLTVIYHQIKQIFIFHHLKTLFSLCIYRSRFLIDYVKVLQPLDPDLSCWGQQYNAKFRSTFLSQYIKVRHVIQISSRDKNLTDVLPPVKKPSLFPYYGHNVKISSSE